MEGSGVEDIIGAARLVQVRGRHGLLGLKGWTGSQDVGAWCTEWHGLGLHHPLPRVVAGGPRPIRATRVALARGAAAVASATAAPAPPIRSVVAVVVGGACGSA